MGEDICLPGNYPLASYLEQFLVVPEQALKLIVTVIVAPAIADVPAVDVLSFMIPEKEDDLIRMGSFEIQYLPEITYSALLCHPTP